MHVSTMIAKLVQPWIILKGKCYTSQKFSPKFSSPIMCHNLMWSIYFGKCVTISWDYDKILRSRWGALCFFYKIDLLPIKKKKNWKSSISHLKKRLVIVVIWCYLCKRNGESVDHLVLHCEVSCATWNEIFSRIGLSWVMPRRVVDLFAC
jgi:hypothetical protein